MKICISRGDYPQEMFLGVSYGSVTMLYHNQHHQNIAPVLQIQLVLEIIHEHAVSVISLYKFIRNLFNRP